MVAYVQMVDKLRVVLLALFTGHLAVNLPYLQICGFSKKLYVFYYINVLWILYLFNDFRVQQMLRSVGATRNKG